MYNAQNIVTHNSQNGISIMKLEVPPTDFIKVPFTVGIYYNDTLSINSDEIETVDFNIYVPDINDFFGSDHQTFVLFTDKSILDEYLQNSLMKKDSESYSLGHQYVFSFHVGDKILYMLTGDQDYDAYINGDNAIIVGGDTDDIDLVYAYFGKMMEDGTFNELNESSDSEIAEDEYDEEHIESYYDDFVVEKSLQHVLELSENVFDYDQLIEQLCLGE